VTIAVTSGAIFCAYLKEQGNKINVLPEYQFDLSKTPMRLPAKGENKISQAPFLSRYPILSLPFYTKESFFNSMR
jgi:hypothetical protein